jgi:hypothetical protein
VKFMIGREIPHREALLHCCVNSLRFLIRPGSIYCEILNLRKSIDHLSILINDTKRFSDIQFSIVKHASHRYFFA